MSLVRVALAASSLLCIIIELGHMGRFGHHSEVEHSLSQVCLASPCHPCSYSRPVSGPEVLVALSSGNHPTFPLQLKFLTAASFSRVSLTLLCTFGLEACQTRPRGHSFLRKADFFQQGRFASRWMSCETDWRCLAFVAIGIRNACLPISITVKSCDMTVV